MLHLITPASRVDRQIAAAIALSREVLHVRVALVVCDRAVAEYRGAVVDPLPPQPCGGRVVRDSGALVPPVLRDDSSQRVAEVRHRERLRRERAARRQALEFVLPVLNVGLRARFVDVLLVLVDHVRDRRAPGLAMSPDEDRSLEVTTAVHLRDAFRRRCRPIHPGRLGCPVRTQTSACAKPPPSEDEDVRTRQRHRHCDTDDLELRAPRPGARDRRLRKMIRLLHGVQCSTINCS